MDNLVFVIYLSYHDYIYSFLLIFRDNYTVYSSCDAISSPAAFLQLVPWT